MNKFGHRELLVFALILGVIMLALPGEAWGQIRVRPRPSPSRPRPAESSKSSALDVKGSVAQLLNRQGLAHYHEHPGDLLALIRQAVDEQRKFPDTAQNRSPWGVMHTTLAWGPLGEILVGDQPYNAIRALCENQRLKGVHILAVKAGLPHPLEGPGLQGHPCQLLAILAQNNVPLEHPLQIGDQSFTVADLVKYEQKTCKPNMELTFKLLGLSHYLPLNETWTAEDGGAWSVERLLRLELRQPINGQQTCGGTHRLMAIHLATAKRIREGGEITGAWSSAAKYTDDYHAYALSLINPDGSCSTDWLERRAALDDPQRRVQTTGHVLEWLAVSLPAEKLRNEKLMGSYAYLAALLRVDIGETWSVGPRAHALRALRIYHDRLAATLPTTPEVSWERLANEIEIPSPQESGKSDLVDSSDQPQEPQGTDTTHSGPGKSKAGNLEKPERVAGRPAGTPQQGTDKPESEPTGTEPTGTDTRKPNEAEPTGTDTRKPNETTGQPQGKDTDKAPGTDTDRTSIWPLEAGV